MTANFVRLVFKKSMTIVVTMTSQWRQPDLFQEHLAVDNFFFKMGVLIKLNLVLLLVFIERKSSCKVIFYYFTPERQLLPSAPNADLSVLSRSLEGLCLFVCRIFLQFLHLCCQHRF